VGEREVRAGAPRSDELIELPQHRVAHHRRRDARRALLHDVVGAHAALERVLHRALESAAPSDAEGSMPSEPVSIAAQSDSKSPKRLSVTMTSNCFGLRTSCIAQLSAYMCESSTSLYSVSCSFCISSRHSTPDSMTLAFSTEQTLLLRLRASSKATRPTRMISGVV